MAGERRSKDKDKRKLCKKNKERKRLALAWKI
jgi:hypothetical protein